MNVSNLKYGISKLNYYKIFIENFKDYKLVKIFKEFNERKFL